MIDRIWQGGKPYIIAEISQNHDGSLGQAHAFIDAVAVTGADAIKFQTHIAEEESSIYEPFRIKFSYEDKSRYDYWKRMEFTELQWRGLIEHALEVGLDFLSSPFSIKALEMLDRLGVPAWKFGAGEVFNTPLIDRAISTGKPLLLSTGLSTYDEISERVERIKRNGNKLLLFQCTTEYPSKANTIDIKLIREYSKRYRCAVGISDHSSTIYPAIAAATLGANAIEVHVTMSKYMFGPDIKASVSIEQLKQIVEGTQFVSEMLSTSVDMSNRNQKREELKCIFSKSLCFNRDLEKDTLIEEEFLAAVKPNKGIALDRINEVIGKRLIRNVKKHDFVKIEDLI